jgi:uncharacterized protein YjbI with pentapeptide repeats
VKSNLWRADLNGANLRGADVLMVDLGNTNLRGVIISDSIIINPENYQSLLLDQDTDFTGAVIDDASFIDYISKFTKLVPQKIKSRNEFETEVGRQEIRKRNRWFARNVEIEVNLLMS